MSALELVNSNNAARRIRSLTIMQREFSADDSNNSIALKYRSTNTLLSLTKMIHYEPQLTCSLIAHIIILKVPQDDQSKSEDASISEQHQIASDDNDEDGL